MRVLGIDPNLDNLAWALYDTERRCCVLSETVELEEAFERLHGEPGDPCADVYVVERLRSFLMRVGQNVFDAQWIAGRAYEALLGTKRHWLDRQRVKLTLTGHARAKDADIRALLIDAHGGSRRAAVGIKADPGPLYGVKKDEWQALAVAVAWAWLNGGDPR